MSLDLNIRCRENLNSFEPQYPMTTLSPLPSSSLATDHSSTTPQTTLENSVNSTVTEEEEIEDERKESGDSRSSLGMILGNANACLFIIQTTICICHNRLCDPIASVFKRPTLLFFCNLFKICMQKVRGL